MKSKKWFFTTYPADDSIFWEIVLAVYDDENDYWWHIQYSRGSSEKYCFSDLEYKNRFDTPKQAKEYADILKRDYIAFWKLK